MIARNTILSNIFIFKVLLGRGRSFFFILCLNKNSIVNYSLHKVLSISPAVILRITNGIMMINSWSLIMRMRGVSL